MKEKSIPQLLNEVIKEAQEVQKLAFNSLHSQREILEHDCKLQEKGFCLVCYPENEWSNLK